MIRAGAALSLMLVLLSAPAWPQGADGPAATGQAADPSAAPALVPARSSITADGRDGGKPRPLTLTLGLTRPVPHRVALIDAPPRLVIDLDGAVLPPQTALPGADLVPALRWGTGQRGWSRVVVELPGPMRIDRAALSEGPALVVRLSPVAADDFGPRRDALAVLRGLPQPAEVRPPASRDGRVRVVIDPGHGGFDPGAQVGAISEAAVMLGFARELAAALGTAGIEAVLTRDDDRFVALERRTTIARAQGADLLISLHADALPAGAAAGATIYTWDEDSNDRAARQLALRHDRDDMLAGIDLADTDEAVTGALIDLARRNTQPRSEDFARRLTAQLAAAGIGMHRTPMRGAAFSVLKSPDIPSVLLELGFLTDPADRANLFNPEWREGMARAIAASVRDWAAAGGELVPAGAPGPQEPARR
ncbi:N-acetylmuramoyl-L-alanine amidase [Paracoccus luteus]|uniref:N-acetylmuramoyl-L-alanine amidase n=1 Tax=Paracoccus luteus TaxID=2508543 RepID=UPI001FE75D41|nr:N-acetylmuramoyl-L-alanine amidase [Paracoccus luteus]